MVLKYFFFFLFIILLSIFAIINDNIDFNKLNFKFTRFATLYFEDVKSYQMSVNGVKREIEAKSIIRYDDIDDITKLSIIMIKENNSTQRLKADKAKYYKKRVEISPAKFANQEIYFRKNVVYRVDENMTLKSQTMVYNLKKDTILSDTDFNATNGESRVWGSSFFYKVKEKKIFAKNIKSELFLEK